MVITIVKKINTLIKLRSRRCTR